MIHSYKIVIFSIFNIFFLNAQINSTDSKMEKLDTKSKAELIKMAQDILEQKYPEIHLDFNEFDCRVWNGSYNITKVIFRRAIRYISNSSENIHYDITVNLNTNEITPLDNENEKGVLYLTSKKGEKIITDLKKKNLLPKEIESDIEYSIAENEDYYLISCFNDLPNVDKRLAIHEREFPFLQKSLISKKTGKSLFFKEVNLFYYLTQLTFEHYYNKNLYIILNEEDKTSNDLDEIVKIAYSILKSKQPNLKINPKDFEIIILGNYKDIIVKYRRYIRLKNSNEKRVFDLAVNIITKEVFPFDSSDASFYIPSESDNSIINEIQHKLPLPLNPKMEHTIVENEDYFWITSISEKSVKKYFIDKSTGNVTCFYESSNLPINNREDISLQEQYTRVNGFFTIKTENNKPLIDMALAILKEKQFTPNINPDDYSIESKASKDEVTIKFFRLIKFVPLRHKEESKNYLYDLEVSLVSKTIAQDPTQFYFPTEEDTNTIEFVKNQFTKHLKDSEEINYPIEIVEETDCFIIRTANTHNFDEGSIKHYRMDKKSAAIEVITSLSNFFPNPAPMPIPFNEIKK